MNPIKKNAKAEAQYANASAAKAAHKNKNAQTHTCHICGKKFSGRGNHLGTMVYDVNPKWEYVEEQDLWVLLTINY